MALLTLFGCNSFSKFAPEKYFAEGDKLMFANAIYHGNSKQIKRLLSDNAIDVNAPIPFSPIHELIVGGAGDMKRIKYLMEHGLDLNVPDNSGDTPVITATIVRDRDLVEYLGDMEQTPGK